MSKSELTRSLTPDRGCQPAGHTCVIPSAKDAFPCAWGAITWATSRVKPWPLLILLPWVTRVPALPCPGEKAHGNSTFSMFHQRRKRSPPVQPARWPSKDAPPPAPTKLLSLPWPPSLFSLIFFLTGARGLSKCKGHRSLPMASQMNQLLSRKPACTALLTMTVVRPWGRVGGREPPVRQDLMRLQVQSL